MLNLARLRVQRGRPLEARKLLTPVCERFTEGLGIKDLRAARALLETLPSDWWQSSCARRSPRQSSSHMNGDGSQLR